MRKCSVDKDGVKKGPWSEEEDNKLRSYILRYGHWNWRLLPKFAGLARCGKSCRLRWVNYLKPGLKRGSFTHQEQLLVAKLHHQLGNKWSAMAARLPGRTDNEIKNYWHTHLKKRTQSPFSEQLILEASGTTLNSQNQTASEDSTAASSSQYSAQEVSTFCGDQLLAPENSDELTSFNKESFSSLTDGFEGSFWTSPFLVDDSDYSFSPLMEEPELYLFA